MNLTKLLNRAILIKSDMPLVAEKDGKKYRVLTAKKLRNQTRVGPDEYFGIVLGEEIQNWADLKKI